MVIAIIAILASLLLPALAKAKAKAHQAVCLNNFKQLEIMMQLYADDHEDKVVHNGNGLIEKTWVGGVFLTPGGCAQAGDAYRQAAVFVRAVHIGPRGFTRVPPTRARKRLA